MLFAKEPAKVEVFNDLDQELVNFFRVVRDPKLCAKLHAAAHNTMYARGRICSGAAEVRRSGRSS